MSLQSKWSKLGLALSSTLLLAACGGGDSAEDTGDQDAETTEETTEETASESSGETIEITFWHAMNGPHQEALTALTEAFNESQDQYVVNEQSQGNYDDLNQSVTAAAVSNELPTMAQLTATDVPEWASNDLLVPLSDDFLTSNGFDQDAIDDIYDGFLESSVFEGERYAMPFSKSTRVMFYNQDILDEYDVEVPESWDDITELGQMMVDNGDDAFAMGFENGFEMEWEQWPVKTAQTLLTQNQTRLT